MECPSRHVLISNESPKRQKTSLKPEFEADSTWRKFPSPTEERRRHDSQIDWPCDLDHPGLIHHFARSLSSAEAQLLRPFAAVADCFALLASVSHFQFGLANFTAFINGFAHKIQIDLGQMIKRRGRPSASLQSPVQNLDALDSP